MGIVAVIVVENELVNQVEIFIKAVLISLHVNILKKGMYSIV